MTVLILLISCLNLLLLAVILFLVQRPDTASEKINYDNKEIKEIVLSVEKFMLNNEKKLERSLIGMKEQNTSELNKLKDIIIKRLNEVIEER